MIKIATPISHLFNNIQFAREIIENSDCLECRDHSLNADFENQELFHSDIEPIHELKHNDLASLKEIAIKKPELRLISFHLGSSFLDPELKQNMYFPKGKEIGRASCRERV